ncbi:MAG: hypothetical protein ACKO9S_02080 [Bacteroidota bacterium]
MKKTLLILSFTLLSFSSFATHLMGGQITARNIGGLTYEITLTLYRDSLGIPMGIYAIVEFIDANTGVPLSGLTIYPNCQPAISLGNGVEKYLHVDTVTFPYAGAFKALYSTCCRNGSILNLPDPLSKSLFLDALILADPTNSTPEFLNDPITLAQDSVPFSYNPAPFDADGDSLAWIMDIPLDQSTVAYLGVPIQPYSLPPSDTSNPFALNPNTGEITFTPINIGNFQISVKAIEYRNGQPIGYIRRDMQLIVLPSPNAPIVVNAVPNVNRLSSSSPSTQSAPIYVSPGQHLSFLFETLNPDNGMIEVTLNGDAFNAATPALVTSNPPYATNGSTSSTVTVVDWYPTQAEVRTQPYSLIFRVADFFGPFKFYTDYSYPVVVTNNPTGLGDSPISSTEATLVKTIDVLGRTIANDSKGVLIRIYSNGTAKKFHVME